MEERSHHGKKHKSSSKRPLSPSRKKSRSPAPRAYRQRSESPPPPRTSKSKRRENGEKHKRPKAEESRNHRQDDSRKPRRSASREDDRKATRRRDEAERRRHIKREKNSSKYEWGGQAIKQETQEEQLSAPPKEKPNLQTSGKLAEDTNVYNGVVIKYSEPEDARKPKRRWRLYRFKGDSEMPLIQLHRQSAYLFGRQRLVADIPIDHPSCSKQHAVLQFRLVPYQRPDGTKGRRVRPYLIDLGSSNGTYINNKRIDPSRYVELIEMDVIKFGYSSREYVILHEDVEKKDENLTADEEFQEEDKDVVEAPPPKKTKQLDEET